MCGIGLLLSLACAASTTPSTSSTPEGDDAHSAYFAVLLAYLTSRGPDVHDALTIRPPGAPMLMSLASTVLHMRGSGVCKQPLADSATGNTLAWNGEIFGGGLEIDEREEGGDTLKVFTRLQELLVSSAAADSNAEKERRIVDFFSTLHGPFAFIFYAPSLQTVFFGRDPLGRRSLVIQLPSSKADDHRDSNAASSCRLVISSNPIPAPMPGGGGPLGVDEGFVELEPRGVYVLRLASSPPSSSPSPPPPPPVSLPFWRAAGHGESPLCIDLLPWNRGLCLSTLPRMIPSFLLTEDAAKPVGFASDEEVASSSIVLLKALNESVRVRVSNAPSPRLFMDRTPLPAPLATALRTVIVQQQDSPSLPQLSPVMTVTGSMEAVLEAAKADGFTLPARSCGVTAAEEAEAHFQRQQLLKRLLPSNALSYLQSSFPSSPLSSAETDTGACVAVLFSGGLDSMMLAALAHHHVPASEPIDLINVCFASPLHQSPDRQGAIAGVRELRCVFPSRQWQLICVDESVANVYAPSQQLAIAKLLFPRLLHIDFNIGSALSYASRGVGWVDVEETEEVKGGGKSETTFMLAEPKAFSTTPAAGVGSAAASEGGKAGKRGKQKAAPAAPGLELRYGGGAGNRGSNLSDFNNNATAEDKDAAVIAGAAGSPEGGKASSPHDRIAAVALDTMKKRGENLEGLLRKDNDGSSFSLLNRTLAPSDFSANAEKDEAEDQAMRLAAALIERYGGKDLLSVACPSPPPAADARGDDSSRGDLKDESPAVPTRMNPVTGQTVALCSGVKASDGSPCKSGKPALCKNGLCKAHCKGAQLRALNAGEGNDQQGSVVVPCPLHPLTAFDKGERGASTGAGTVPSPEMKDGRGAATSTTDSEVIVAASASAAPTTTTHRRHLRVLVRSSARVLLSGLGADEQLGGYARHRTAWAHGGWQRVGAELDLDVDRLWYRNLGRDDRLISSHGVELRLPFLDEQVQAVCKTLPLHTLLDLRLPFGVGDKRALRVCASLLGMKKCALLVKRAIHFGSRIAKQSNIRAFGSNAKGDGAAAFAFSFAVTASGGGEGDDE